MITGRRILTLLVLVLLGLILVWAPVFDWMSPRRIERDLDGAGPRVEVPRAVLVVSIDGLAPRFLGNGHATTLARLAAEGTSARRAFTILPSITLTSHTSMLSGVLPEVHGVHWNRYQPWSEIRIPTLFSRCAEDGLRCGLFAGKRKFAHFAEDEPGVERYVHGETAGEVLGAALDYLRARRPDFTLVHLAEVDLAGHGDGWGSEVQLAAIAETDAALGPFLRDARAAAGRPFVAILTADHGGHGTRHGTALPDDLEIPWIAWGDGIEPGRRIAEDVSTVDTAATVLTLLGGTPPADWQGRPRLGSQPGLSRRAQP